MFETKMATSYPFLPRLNGRDSISTLPQVLETISQTINGEIIYMNSHLLSTTGISNLTKGLCIFHKNVSKIPKRSKNPFFKSNYANLSDILEAIKKPLDIAGLVVMQFPVEEGLTTMLTHADSGEFIQATYRMPIAKPNDPQATGSAITYARRYAIAAILALDIDDDDDANSASGKGNRSEKNSKPQERVAAPKMTATVAATTITMSPPVTTFTEEDDLEITTLLAHFSDLVRSIENFDDLKKYFEEGWRTLSKYKGFDAGRAALNSLKSAYDIKKKELEDKMGENL